MMKRLLKKIIPKRVILFYHRVLAWVAAWVEGFPSERLIVIGVTGTRGKSTTSYLIAKALEAGGATVGLTSTVYFKIGEREWLNDTKMTMLGRFRLQRMLREMVRAGCTHVVIETSSEGILQSRHAGINYDVAVFTNLSREHLEAHGGFESYKRAKQELFSQLMRKPHKGKQKKVNIVNLDSPHALDFSTISADAHWGFGQEPPPAAFGGTVVPISNVHCDLEGCAFDIDHTTLHLQLLGAFNVANAAAALTVGLALGFPIDRMRTAFETLTLMPGRMERIDEGQPFQVMVDYAHDEASFEAMFDAVKMMKFRRIIHVFGSAGGVRDHAKRPVLGRLSGTHADLVVITNEDCWDEDPQKIIREIKAGALSVGKKEGIDLYTVLDRREGIRKGLALAGPNDLVLVTGKGTEQFIVYAPNQRKPWDDRVVTRQLLKAWSPSGVEVGHSVGDNLGT
jgi:UDP-N-acetylmuramoyl-L-alanyl-D-glutamate--2,6-diaminopimelate ligase